MTPFEDLLRDAMRSHASDAPHAADLSAGNASAELTRLTPIAGNGRVSSVGVRRWVPVAAAACVVLLLAAALAVHGLRHRSGQSAAVSPALACPASSGGLTPKVPHEPQGVNGSDRLVPDQTPTSAVICAWTGQNTNPSNFTFTGRRVLTGSLAAITAQLRWAPQTNPGVGGLNDEVGGTQIDYLVGLRYRSAIVWVATATEPNDVIGATNGRFASAYGFGPTAAASLRTGRWTPTNRSTERDSGCDAPDVGRFGQESRMVPAGATSVTLCQTSAAPPKPRVTEKAGFSPFVAALNALPTHNGGSGGECSKSPPIFYRLIFRYPQGPAVIVDVSPGCRPAVGNNSLASDQQGDVVTLVKAALAAG